MLFQLSTSNSDSPVRTPAPTEQACFKTFYPFSLSKHDMAVLNPRSRMISIRLSEEEYIAVRRLCSATGARSVSDLARDAMRVLIKSTGREDVLGIHVDEFRSQMRNLDRKIEQLAADITSLKANGHK